jgi:hypothetical protein
MNLHNEIIKDVEAVMREGHKANKNHLPMHISEYDFQRRLQGKLDKKYKTAGNAQIDSGEGFLHDILIYKQSDVKWEDQEKGKHKGCVDSVYFKHLQAIIEVGYKFRNCSSGEEKKIIDDLDVLSTPNVKKISELRYVIFFSTRGHLNETDLKRIKCNPEYKGIYLIYANIKANKVMIQ